MKSLQDNIVFLIVFFSTLIAVTTAVITLGKSWIDKKFARDTLSIKENSAGKTAIEEIKETMRKDRDSVNSVLGILQENFKVIIDKLINATKNK